jgi:hypothetical protein
MDNVASPPALSTPYRPRREPPGHWRRAPSGSHLFEFPESDTAWYQRFSGVARPPRRRHNDLRQALEPDGCVSAIRIAAPKHEETGAVGVMRWLDKREVSCMFTRNAFALLTRAG